MITPLMAFTEALREAGIPISQSELADAAQALGEANVTDREEFRMALAVTMVKESRHLGVFHRLFDVFFPSATIGPDGTSVDVDQPWPHANPDTTGELETLREMMLEALRTEDTPALRRLAREAVRRYGGLERGRAVSGVYYTYRTLRQLDVDGLLQALLNGLTSRDETDDLTERLNADRARSSIDGLKAIVIEEITRELVADRGSEAVARTIAARLPEDTDIVHASREELAALQRAMTPLARKLAARLRQRHRSLHPAQLDFRRTMRSAMSTGGVPVSVVFRPPRPSKPEIVLVADISGSVASFARFTMQLVFAMSAQFQRVRSFVFIDEVDEVTEFFRANQDINEALRAVNTKAKVIHLDGHSDYGNAISRFSERYGMEIGPRTSVIFCGDARNNYHDSGANAFGAIAAKAKHVFWLNPEPVSYWDSGDSIISTYAPYCDGVFECRTLRQLEEFVRIAL
ncbi:MAG: vWA domain-containing protein [Acidimicrobiales bacterium]